MRSFVYQKESLVRNTVTINVFKLTVGWGPSILGQSRFKPREDVGVDFDIKTVSDVRRFLLWLENIMKLYALKIK